MAQNVADVYKDKATIITDLVTTLQTRLPDAEVGPDALFRILFEVFAEVTESLFLSQQLLHDDMFIQSASALSLQRAGDMFGRPQKGGVAATGSVLFSGAGGTYIAIGTQVGAPRDALGDTLVFATTIDGTIPNPGIPTAPVAADHGSGGTVSAGTYEYSISFVTAAGETEIGAISNALTIAGSHSIDLTAIPLGNAGTTKRRIYRRLNGGAWKMQHEIADNTTTTYNDNTNAAGSTDPLADSTAEAIVLTVQAEDSGSDYNVVPGGISVLVDAISGVTDATNTAPMVGGTDPEDIEDFRAALLAWVRAPMSGSPQDLIAWAESVDGVETASVFPNVDLSGSSAPGTVSVRISGPDATIPDSDTITAVQTLLGQHDLANITILVGTFSAHTITATVTVTPSTGYVVLDVTPAVQSAVSEYINSVPVGGTVYKAGILKAVFGLVGVDNVTSTFTDTTSTATQKPTAGTITVS